MIGQRTHRRILRCNNHAPQRRRSRARLHRDDGQVTVAFLILLPALLILAGLVVDGGAALDLHTRALDVAESAARAGAQQLDLTALRAGRTVTPRLDPDTAVATAERYIRSAGLAGTAQATTSQVHVEVTASGRTRLLGVIGIDSFHAHAAASAQPDTGTNERLGGG